MPKKTVILVTKTVLGSPGADEEPFGVEMLDKFFHTLETQPEKPHAICFYTEGVKVLCQGSPNLLGLKLLEGMGVRLVACQTCLDHYGLGEALAAGGTGGMQEIVALIAEADKVVTI